MKHLAANTTDLSNTTVVMVMAYGTPRSPEEILPYYTDIRRGRPPSDEQLAHLTARYEAIGGLSPLARLTDEQCAGLQNTLDVCSPGQFVVYLGLKHASPQIEDAAADALANGATRFVGLVLAPQYSAYSVGQYVGRLTAVAEPGGAQVASVRSWATTPAFIEFTARDLRRRINNMPGRCRVVFTAHSLPQRIIDAGDAYPDELRATAQAVADRLGLVEGIDWQIAWQSAGRTPEPWLGPSILDVVDELGADPTVDGVVVSSVGFVADHLEVLFDLDIEARDRAESVGLAFDRTSCVNDNPEVLAALAQLVVSTATDAFGPAQ